MIQETWNWLKGKKTYFFGVCFIGKGIYDSWNIDEILTGLALLGIRNAIDYKAIGDQVVSTLKTQGKIK